MSSAKTIDFVNSALARSSISGPTPKRLVGRPGSVDGLKVLPIYRNLSGGGDAPSDDTPADDSPFTTMSIALDGADDYLSTTVVPSSFGTSNYSISLWFNINSGATDDHPYFFVFGSNSSQSANTYQGLGLTQRSGDGYKVRVNNYHTSYTQTASASTSDVTAGTWYNLVLVRDGNLLTLYKDGSSFLTLTNTEVGTNDFNQGSELRIGYGYGAGYNTRYINGLIDEFAIFNSALTATDAYNIWNGGAPNDLGTDGLNLDLAHYWRMGDGPDDTDSGGGTPESGDTVGTVFDRVGSSNATTPNGALYSNNLPVLPFSNYALALDGTNDYVDCGGASDFSFTDGSGTDSAFSISAWVKLDSTDRMRLVSKDTSLSSREYLFGTNGTNKFNMILGTGSVNLDIQNNFLLNTTDWFHVVATYDGSKSASGLKVYVNTDTSSLTDNSLGSYTGMPSTTSNLEIGRFANGHSFFNGLVDEIAVFSKELTASDVTNIYNTGLPNDIGTNGLNLDPLAWWRMGDNDGGTGTTVTDQGSGGNNGTLTNGPTFSTTVPS
jgi:hypothetical protein